MALRVARTPGFGPSYPGFRRTIRAAAGYCALVLMALSTGSCKEPIGLVTDPDPDFDVDLRYWGQPPTEEQQGRIANAVARWERIITRGLPPAVVTGDAGCGPGSPAIDEEVDDVVVFVRIIDIEALAESGPCRVRVGTGTRLPITATVWIDGPDRIDQLDPEFLENLVTHELGHALGFGTLWDDKSLLREASLTGGRDPYFAGVSALAEFNSIGGLAVAGNKVPVERLGGAGTADSHWRESVFGERELMSFTVLLGENPLSRVTAASMADLGYDVDLAAADEYVLPGRQRAAVAPREETLEYPRLTESTPRWSITVNDPAGAIVRGPEGR
ncbi:MAG: leishmanolysin-related zinc metalloendopeptidase [Gemmatimonadota bacterium]